ncbi:hypothetical protein A5658_04900 [Mycobacterium sp. 1245111.1]|uniref:hypothetical protein n=1 Tax=Mycobacterium sp. 1245111.1 TaxID=1834073 RepID=UPI000800D281|nr:hypothetical protein [Mycobacterium sp. 1245111.1]OBK36999.1 hypothetical protein A5658_04900 [Mycobacterium sp. 1245111.1]
MTEKYGAILDPANFGQNQKQRIHALVDEFLTDDTMSPNAELAAMNSLLNEVLPPPAAPVPAPRPHVDAPLDDWARDDQPAPRTPSPPDQPAAAPWGAHSPTTGGGGGKVADVFTPAAPADTDDLYADNDDDYEDRYALWSPPKPATVVVPDDVADIEPVHDQPPATPPEPATDPIPLPGSMAPATARRLLASASQRWKTAPSWLRIATPAAAGMAIALVAALALTGHHDTTPIDGPRPTAEAPATTALSPAAAPLMPSDVKSECPAGSSPNPGLIFGSDKSQAWICTRVYGVDSGVLTISFNQPVIVSSITVVAGFDYVEPSGADHWNEHRVVTQILWRFPGQIVQKINPTRGGATLTLPNIATQVITATIQKTQRPPAVPNKDGGLIPGILGGPDATKVDQSFAIGHITIVGRPAGGAT